MDPARILLVVSERPPVVSGVARSVSHLVDGLRARGHDVEVLSADDAPYLAREDIRISGLAMRLPALLRHIGDVDIVNIHGPVPTISDTYLAAIGALRRDHRPGIVYTHHFTVELAQRWMQPLLRSYDALTRRLAGFADHVVVTTDSYADLLSRHVRPDRLSVVGWGFDPERFCRSDRDAFDGRRQLRVLYVGQLREYKGAHVAVDALANLEGVSLTIVGSGPHECALRERIAEHGAENVTLVGHVSDDELSGLYADHDVVLLPSINRLEAFGIVLLEGMASGCVPVASDLPGVRDMAADCGMLAAPSDAVDLRWAVQVLVDRPELLACYRQRSLERAAQFSWAATVDGYEDVFEAVLTARSRTPAVS